MKKIIKLSTVIVLALLIVLTAAPFTFAADDVSTGTEYISNYLTYTEKGFTASSDPQQAFVLNYTPGGDIMPVVTYGSAVYGGQSISGAATDWEKTGNKVIAAVNADFFSTTSGIPMGILITEGKLRAYGGQSTVAGFYAAGGGFITTADIDITVKNMTVASQSWGNTATIDVLAFNHLRQSGGVYLFDSEFSTTTRTTTDGVNVVLKVDTGAMTVGGGVTATVESVVSGADAVELKEGRMVLSVDSAWSGAAVLNGFSVGDKVAIGVSSTSNELKTAWYTTGGGDVIVSGGFVTTESLWDTTISTTAAPRTAMGVKSDGSIVFYCVDGRQNGYSTGLTLKQLAQEMIAQGCVTAINLDGGGSTAIGVMDTATGNFVLENKPSNGTQRTCSTYILLTAVYAPDGVPARLRFVEEDICIMAGGTATLSGVTATDRGYKPVALNEDVSYFLTGNIGSLSGLKFTAANTAASGTVTAVSKSGLRGVGSINVVKSPQAITINTDSQKDVASLSVTSGDVVKLSASATHFGKAVKGAENASFEYYISGNIGSISENGTFTAADQRGSGTIMVLCGNARKEIPVTVTKSYSDVAKDDWYYDAVNFASEKGLFSGTSDTEFSPNAPMTRGMFVTVLGRLEGIDPEAYAPPVDSCTVAVGEAIIRKGPGTSHDLVTTVKRGAELECVGKINEWYAVKSGDHSGYIREDLVNVAYTFTDVPADAYYEGYVNWAVSKGIVGGYGEGKFGPNDVLTREQLAVILYNFTLRTKGAQTFTQSIGAFPDAANVSDWAVDAMNWACHNKYIGGMDGSLNPKGSANRAQVATILMNYLK
ncbi:MAG: S-layer homology domain-containing protein [Oscillospiraceae bacterium]|nr:S-layer homology domain-containing protein [Oscillospiraceae bacterium]